jgi:hypothetical protein
MLFLLSEKLYHINVICVTDFYRDPNIFLSKNGAPTGNYDTVSGGFRGILIAFRKISPNPSLKKRGVKVLKSMTLGF